MSALSEPAKITKTKHDFMDILLKLFILSRVWEHFILIFELWALARALIQSTTVYGVITVRRLFVCDI